MGSIATDAAALAHFHPLAWAGALVLIGCLLLALAAMALLLRQSRHIAAHLRAARTQIDEMRGRDMLTGLVTRADFESALDIAVLACNRGGRQLALIYVGLDGFRQINDGYGHRVGDAVLVEAAHRLSQGAQDRPLVSRVGGDEFALLLDCDAAGAARAAVAVLRRLQRPFTVLGFELRMSASVGVARYPEHGSRPLLMGHAALAMRSVKFGGGSAHATYDPTLGVDLREQAELAQELRRAVERGQLQLYFQPKIDARSLQVTAAEALLRWQHPQRGMILPAVFVPLAERHGLMVELGRWVVEEACRHAAAWRSRGLRMRVAVNVSGQQMRQEDLVAHILAQLDRHGIPHGRLTCEITESVAMEDTALTRRAFEQMGAAGLHVSIDDFGTGHSSLAALRRLPAAELKIDRAFVADLADPHSGERARSIVGAVLQMARSLKLHVVAEGVETAAQRDALVALGCDELQGYLFAKPMTASALMEWADRAQAAAHPEVEEQADGDSTWGADFRPSLFEPTAPAPLDTPPASVALRAVRS